MKVTQTIQLDDRERMAINKVLGLCDEISEIARCSMVDVFEHLVDHSNLAVKYEYSVDEILYIEDMG